VSLKHCIYLEQFKSELTEEALSFMTYVKEVEEAYQQWVKERRAEGKAEGKIELVNKMVAVKFGSDVLTSEVINRLTKLTESQLDEFITKIFEWQKPGEMLVWLENV
jgi:hypothetical protein